MLQLLITALMKTVKPGGAVATLPLITAHGLRPRTLAAALAARPPARGVSASASTSYSSPATASASGAAPAPPADVDGADGLPFTHYSAASNAAYWKRRPVTVAKRLLQVGTALGVWVASGKLRLGAAPEQRADRLRRILTDLGPTFVKIGQAVSSRWAPRVHHRPACLTGPHPHKKTHLRPCTAAPLSSSACIHRPDVLPPEFLLELEKLQDRLPPFPSDQARAVLASELGRPVADVFSAISPAPVAAASLGQVYRATLRADGTEVAVKVQRPGVLASIALDVYVLRHLATGVRAWGRLNSDLPALLDEWAASLFRELDYRAEAANGERFAALYGDLDGVFVPGMRTDLTTRRVLVMEWVEGERLRTAYTAASDGAEEGGSGGGGAAGAPRGSSDDDLRLVEVGVRCSLEQMLAEGFYHAVSPAGRIVCYGALPLSSFPLSLPSPPSPPPPPHTKKPSPPPPPKNPTKKNPIQPPSPNPPPFFPRRTRTPAT
jgi:aarF domain-containing kinase